jgi:hypothetical protein
MKQKDIQEQINSEILTQSIKTRYDEWPVTSLSHDEQVAWAQEYVPSRLVALWQTKDAAGNPAAQHPEEVIVPQSLFEAVSEALQNPTLPENLELPEGADREQAAAQLKALCSLRIVVRGASFEQYLEWTGGLPPEALEQLPHEEQFVLISTFEMRQQEFLRQFDTQLGLSAFFQQNNIPLPLSFEKLADLAYMFFLLQRTSAMAGPQITPATVQQMQTMDNAAGGQLFRP